MIKAFKGGINLTRSPLETNDQTIYDTQEKADLHGEHYQQTMYSDNLFDYTREELRIIDTAANDNSVQGYNERFNIIELQKAIEDLEKDKAFGADEIHNQFLIHLPQTKLHELLGIINRIWRKGEFPKDWKLAQIIPILKPGKEAQNVSSYRPISLLSCLSKLVEKMVCNRLTYFIEANNLLRITQFGFRANRSTIDPIISLEQDIRASLINKKVTILVFFDLKSAFDSVNHIKLLKTLADIGIKGKMLTWLISFLSDRKIQVLLEDKVSNTYNINTGVPQGSILSPLLFIILLCTIPNIIPILSKEFADDIVFAITADTLEDAETLMQDAIERFLEWCKKTKLILQPLKTKVMCFTKKKDKTPRLFLEGTEIDVVTRYKYLGMTLDSPNLTWGPHIEQLKSDCMSRVNIMRALTGTTWGANRECLLKIYNAFIKSKITYGCQVLLSASPTNLYELEKIQNAALRVATGAWNSTYIPSLQSEANIIPLELHLQAQSIKYYYKLKYQKQNHPVKHQISNIDNLRNKVWTKIFKKPFVINIEEIINNWNLPVAQPLEVQHPVIPPWIPIENYIHIEMDITSSKSMGAEYNKQVTLNLIRNRYGNYRKIFTDGSKADDNTTGAGLYIEDTNIRMSWKLESNNSIIGAELSAIKQATKWICQQMNLGNTVILYKYSLNVINIKH